MDLLEKRRNELRATLIDVFTSSAGAQRLTHPDDVVKAGIPRRHASAVSKNSKAIVDEVEAVEAAEEWADYIAQTEQDRGAFETDPRKLAESIQAQ